MEVESQQRALLRRLYTGASAFAAVAAAGSVGYWILGQGRWSYGDCLYMTLITLSTVGYGETLRGMDDAPLARAWTVAQIVLGSGALIYFVSSFTALIVEGDLRGLFRRARMQSRIADLHDHVVVCGAGTTGLHVIAELVAARTPFVVIERSAAALKRTSDELGVEILHIVGDATDDDVMLHAGIARAKGVITVLTDDRDNLMVTITARALNDRARIVAKAVLQESRSKLVRAGATSVVSPARIGGIRMVSEIERPAVTQLLDDVLQERGQGMRMEEIPVGGGLSGKPLGALDPDGALGTHVLAAREPDGSWTFNPRPDHVLRDGATLLVVLPADARDRLRERTR